jgi:hypothetical protein
MFQTVTDVDGDQHKLYVQDMAASCGPACVASMAKKAGRHVTDAWVGSLIDRRKPGITALSGVGHDFNTHGTFDVQDALRKVGFRDTYTDKSGRFERAFKRCTKSKPGMAWLRVFQQKPDGTWYLDWNMQQMHWVVILGPARTDPTRYIVLDPAVGYSDQAFDELPYYTAPAGTDGEFTVWNEWGVVTTA